MTIFNLSLLAYELRAAGIKSLSIELEPDPQLMPAPVSLAPVEHPDTERPPAKDATMCAADGCTAESGGILGGVGRQYCRNHALQLAGVKTS